MALTTEELRDGVRYWLCKTDWPHDFHNAFYEHEVPTVRPNSDFNQEWWNRFYPVLRDWGATRGVGRTILDVNVEARFQALGERWKDVVRHLQEDIEGVEWKQICGFPSLVAGIKDVASPVFTSKFCHFLAPRIFPVVDNKAMGNPFPSYEAYFETAREEWLTTQSTTHHKLIGTLTAEIEKAGSPLFGGFPMKCKLIELCLIGRCKGEQGSGCSP